MIRAGRMTVEGNGRPTHGRSCSRILSVYLTVGLLFCLTAARAAISVDAVSTGKVTNLASLTFSHTVGSGANRLLIVGVTMTKGIETCTGVTYGGTALTLIGQSQAGDAAKAYLWKLASPPSGAASVVVTCSAAENFAGGAISFTGVNINTNGGFAAASGTSTAPSVNVTSAAGELVVDAIASKGDGISLAVGTSKTLQWTNKTGTAKENALGGGSTEAGAPSVTMSWTLGASKDWSIGAVSLMPAPTIQADVTTSKTGASTVVAGVNLTYTITITNAGPNTATNIAVTDTLPSGAAFFTASGGGTSNNGAVTWSAFNLAANTSTNFTLTVTAPGGGSMTNTISSSATTYDPDPSNNNGTASGAKVVTAVTSQGSAGNASSSCVTATNVATRTWSHTVSSGNNRILIVGIALANNSQTVSSITYGGVALTRITTSVARNTVDIWKLVAPGVGTSNIVATWTGNEDMAAWSGTFTNVDQTNPIGDSQIANGGDSTPTVTVSATTGDIVVDMLSANGDAGTVTIGGSQTLICSGQTGTGGGDCRGFSSYEAGASSVTMSWSQTANKDWDIAAAVLKVAAPVQADVSVAKTGASTVVATSNLTYTITVTNFGPFTASNIVVSDVLPAGSTFVSASSGGTNASGTVYWTIASLAYNAQTNFTVNVTAPTSGLMTNTASSTATTSDPDASNNNGSASNAKVITTVLQIADVKATKTGAASVYETSNLTYTITVTNLGPNNATNVIVSDLLPTNTLFVGASSGGTNNNGSVVWPTMTNFVANATTNFTVTIAAPTNGVSLTNTVSSTATSTDPDASNNNGTAAAAKVTTTVTPIADVKTTKSGATTVNATSNLTYTITVTNMGPDIATNLIVSDLLPTNVTFVSATSSGTNGNGTVWWPTMTNFAVGATTNFTVIITVPSTAVSLTNTVSSTNTTTDPDLSNNNGTSASAKVTTTVLPIADVKTTKTGAATVTATSNLTYTITVTNLGPGTATNVIVSDLLPTNVTFVSASSGGTNGNGTVWWGTMTNFALGASTNFTVTVTAPASGSITNTVSSSATSTDPDASNNDGSAAGAKVITTILPIADVQTTKSGATTVNATSNLTYTITVTNMGPDIATNLIVSDLLPTNVTFVSATSSGTNGNGTVWWPTMTNFAVGATTNFTVIITVPSTAVSLTNTVSSTNTTTDPDLSNNNGTSASAKVTTTVLPIADVKTTKTGAATVTATSNLTYTITVTNLGPGTATNVIVSDLLPTNVTFVSASSGGTNGNGTVWWGTLTNFALGATTNFTVVVTAPASGSIANTVSSSATSTDPDASNNDGSASNAKVITGVTPVADLKVTKSGAASVVAGSNLTYTITFTNLGPNNATNIVVTDTLPPTATFVSASGGGSYSGGVVTWPAMTNVLGTNFTVTVTAPGSGTLTNVAAGTSSTFDPDASNNDGSATNAIVLTTIVSSADVKTTKAGPTSAAGTSNITYTITVTNHGPSTASNVVVSDVLPAEVTFVSASGGGTTNNGVVTWPTLTNFANAAFTNFTVVVTLPLSGSVTNSASSTADTSDPDASNNNGSSATAKVVTTVAAVFADVATSVSGPASAAARTNLTYTITVTNMGPGTASNVVVLDTLPAGVTFVSASGGGNHSGGLVTWPTLTNFANAATTNFTVTVTAPYSGTITNIVSSTSVTSDPVSSNNDGSSASGQVVTLILGVNVTGFVYLDANKNGFKDTSEAGTSLTLYAKIYATTNASGPALQAAAVDGTTGAYTLTNVYRGLYMVILDNNSLLSDVTPTLPGGWTGGEMPAHIRTNVAVALVNVPDQNFGLIHSLGLSGKVFKDNGTGGGTANDGVKNGSEIGLGGVTVRLTDVTGSTLYDTATTDGNGDYTLLVPNSVANGATLKITETNPPAHLSTGASVGDTGGTYDRASDTVTFTYTTGTAYSGVNFGDVPENSFVNDSQQANLPGTFVLHPHSFTAGSAGSLSLSVSSLPNPSISGWTQVIYRDANCNGQLDPGETAVTGAISVSAGDKVCILIKEFIPGIAPFNAQDQLTVTAAFTWTGASPALSTNTTRIDLTTVGNPTTAGLTLLKAVDKETALPGEVLTYTVTYANHSSAALTNIVIFDQTPAFTTFSSAGHGALPNSVSAIAVTSPGVGASGAIKWTFTGSLAPASASTVSFSVTVSQ